MLELVLFTPAYAKIMLLLMPFRCGPAYASFMPFMV